MKKEFAQGATEYLLIFATVLIIVGAAVYYVSRPSGFPSISTTFDVSDNEIRIKVDVGSIPDGEWAYSVSTVEGSYDWTAGNEVLDSPYVSLGTYLAGTYYVSLKHTDSNHIYFYDQAVAIT